MQKCICRVKHTYVIQQHYFISECSQIWMKVHLICVNCPKAMLVSIKMWYDSKKYVLNFYKAKKFRQKILSSLMKNSLDETINVGNQIIICIFEISSAFNGHYKWSWNGTVFQFFPNCILMGWPLTYQYLWWKCNTTSFCNLYTE